MKKAGKKLSQAKNDKNLKEAPIVEYFVTGFFNRSLIPLFKVFKIPSLFSFLVVGFGSSVPLT